MHVYTDTHVQTQIQVPMMSMHTQPHLVCHTHTHTRTCTHTHAQLHAHSPWSVYLLHSTCHTDISNDVSRSHLLPVWEWTFLWLHFDGCPEALRPGSACVNQYLLLLIIKNKATPCLEHTSPEFPPAAGLQPDRGPGLEERKVQCLPSRSPCLGDGG